jgi:hypothetical protein
VVRLRVRVTIRVTALVALYPVIGRTTVLVAVSQLGSANIIGLLSDKEIFLGLGMPPVRERLVGNAAFRQMNYSCGKDV